MSRRDEIRNLISKNSRRLQALKEQKATIGVHTPAHVLVEIEETEAEIEKLQTDLKSLEASNLQEAVDNFVPKQRVQIYLQGEFSSLSTEKRESIIVVLAALMGISPQEIEVYRVYKGSIIFDLGVPPDAVRRLRLLLQGKRDKFLDLGIEKVIIESETGEVEEELAPISSSSKKAKSGGFFYFLSNPENRIAVHQISQRVLEEIDPEAEETLGFIDALLDIMNKGGGISVDTLDESDEAGG